MPADKPRFYNGRSFTQAWYAAHPSPFYICSLQITKSCPVVMTKYQTTLDHIVPITVDDRYKFDLDNIRPACRDCNSKRSNKNVPRWYVLFGTVPPYRLMGSLALNAYSVARRRNTIGRPAAASIASSSNTSTKTIPTQAVNLASTLKNPSTGADCNSTYAASRTVDIDSMGKTPLFSVHPSVYNHSIKDNEKDPNRSWGLILFVLSFLFLFSNVLASTRLLGQLLP